SPMACDSARGTHAPRSPEPSGSEQLGQEPLALLPTVGGAVEIRLNQLDVPRGERTVEGLRGDGRVQRELARAGLDQPPLGLRPPQVTAQLPGAAGVGAPLPRGTGVGRNQRPRGGVPGVGFPCPQSGKTTATGLPAFTSPSASSVSVSPTANRPS